ncbi:MAG: hydantoinase/carbamoylase family amidase [Anaerolineae bacterium]|nr:hydantoinase/carbamoylase family amidase [Anaerolineae bacterium]MDW8171116.1 hydantoinase/carbamoylase family amidase [Anaerolineae bacterium]
MSVLQPQRTIEELKELRALTGNEDGAQRVAFTPTWDKARDWLRGKLAELPVEIEVDEAGNLWATLRGESEKELLIGGHIDSVPNGGWLDGCLNVMAGVEILRRIAAEGKPPVTVRLVDWADEEGARFGRSLFGSSAASGTMNPDELRHLVDKDGVKLTDAIAKYGLSLDTVKQATHQLKKAAAYLELHIEQGPVLLDMGLPLGVVLGTFGVERHAIRFVGQSAHSGSTPMNRRRDALGAAAKLALEIREIGKRNGGVCTVGRVETKPGIVTAVVGQCDMTLDQRHLDAEALARMYREAQEASYRFAEEEKVEVSWSKIWDIHPILFHPNLVEMCDEAIRETCGTSHRLPSGPLHDAAEVARAGVPTIMMFVQSLHGISHNKIEDTLEEHLVLSVEAFDRLASKAMAWVASQ